MNGRFEDTPELFGRGAGSATCAELTCDICKVVHNEGCTGEAYTDQGESVCYTTFAKLTVCETVENAVLVRVEDLLPWLTRLMDARRQRIEGQQQGRWDRRTHGGIRPEAVRRPV